MEPFKITGGRKMRMKPLATALLLLCVATPAWATTDEILHAAAALVLYQKECGALTPKMEAMADLFRSMHAANELDVLNAVMDANRMFDLQGKETWCRKTRAVVGD
jgi:hypothetical protein